MYELGLVTACGWNYIKVTSNLRSKTISNLNKKGSPVQYMPQNFALENVVILQNDFLLYQELVVAEFQFSQQISYRAEILNSVKLLSLHVCL